MMDKKFIDDLRECDVNIEYTWYCADEGEYETYVVRSRNLNRMLMLTNNKKKWRLVFMEKAEILNTYNNETIFKIFELIKNKMA